ncbi:MAG: SIS domain-containing protein [Gemmatimonadota bacterium]
MSDEARIAEGLTMLARLAEAAAADPAPIARMARRYTDTLRAGGTLLFAGNGGSAADAQHLATEYVVRFQRNRRALSALALSADSSILTAAGNDLGFDQIFARQVEALGKPGDLLVLHSTSGESVNLLRAAEAARRAGVAVVALLGKGGGPLAALVDEALIVPSNTTHRIQEMHLAIEHAIAELVEAELT